VGTNRSRQPGIDRWERDERLGAIYRRPGFMIRRAHQIAIGIFAKECADLDLTPQQHGVLSALAQFPGIDQISLGRLLGLDRSTVAGVVIRLSDRGLVRRSVSRVDRRRLLLALRAAGTRALDASHGSAERAQERLLAPLSATERTQFLTLLERVLDEHNPSTRVPVSHGSYADPATTPTSAHGFHE
jgi:DNA-binding MarR family transcriptional regulator